MYTLQVVLDVIRQLQIFIRHHKLEEEITNGQHHSDHTKEAQTLTISFNQPVTYSSSQGTLAGATTGTTLTINYTYHQNPNDNIGLGDLVVVSDPGLSITGVSITD